MLSKTAQYAIKALIHLAGNSDITNKVLAASLAEQIDVPKPFLSKILQQLANADLVSAMKGPKGGFYLTAEQKDHSLYQVVVAADGKDTFGKCILGLHECDYDNPCAVHHLVSASQTALRENLMNVSLLDAAGDPSTDAYGLP